MTIDTSQPYPEPPAFGTEAETLVGSLERQRATFAWKCADLDADGLRTTIGASTVTLGGLLKHLAWMEDLNFTGELAGRALPAPWDAVDFAAEPGWEWGSAREDSPEQLYRLWQDAVERSRSAIADAIRELGPEGGFPGVRGEGTTVRRLLVDLIEEYARHTGHADLIRESIDGRVGEDPPGGPYDYRIRDPEAG